MDKRGKIKRTYSLPQATVELVETIARKTRRDLSAIVGLAIEEYARRQKDDENKENQPIT